MVVHAGVVRTLHGLDLVGAEDLATAPSLHRLLLPGTPEANIANVVDRWAAERGMSAERIHASGAYAYDATLTDMARDESNVIVREAGIGLEYPTQGLALSGQQLRAEVIARPLALALIGRGALVLVRRERSGRRVRRRAFARVRPVAEVRRPLLPDEHQHRVHNRDDSEHDGVHHLTRDKERQCSQLQQGQPSTNFTADRRSRTAFGATSTPRTSANTTFMTPSCRPVTGEAADLSTVRRRSSNRASRRAARAFRPLTGPSPSRSSYSRTHDRRAKPSSTRRQWPRRNGRTRICPRLSRLLDRSLTRAAPSPRSNSRSNTSCPRE